MVDEIRALRLLSRATNNVSLLLIEANADEAIRGQTTWLPGVKYLLQTAIEACMDVAQHICAASGWGVPNDNGQAMTILMKHRVIEASVEQAMRKAIGLRNVLVHEYVGVDDSIVLARIEDLSDIDAFASQVADWLAASD